MLFEKLIRARFFPLYTFPLLLVISFYLRAGEKSSKDIQKYIDSRKTELQSLRNEIKDIEDKLHRKNKEAISNTEILLSL